MFEVLWEKKKEKKEKNKRKGERNKKKEGGEKERKAKSCFKRQY